MEHDIGSLQTFVYALMSGVLLVAVARKLRIPAIVLLLCGGIVLGPQVLGIIDPTNLGEGLKAIISCGVAVILFEGGLTLDLKGYRAASKVIKRLLSLGVVVTWIATGIIVHALFHYPYEFSLLAGSLVIVTGPTVIGPLLSRIRLKQNLHQILHWEGILIDPVGVFIAVLCFEWVSVHIGLGMAVVQFFGRFFVGIAIGLLGGVIIEILMRRRLIPEKMENLVVLAASMTIFVVCDHLYAESGLLGTVVAGFYLAIRKPLKIEEIREFKAQLTDLLIGLLFVLLAAKLDIRLFVTHGWTLAYAIALLMFVIRPLNIFLSTWNSGLTVREKFVLSWIAPRGIVAASMASLFATSLVDTGHEEGRFLEVFTYSVIAATVVLQGFSAGIVSRLLGTQRPEPTGVLIAGANRLGRELANFITSQAKWACLLVDTNAREVQAAEDAGLVAMRANALDPNLPEDIEQRDIGRVIALTDNEELNTLICQRWGRIVGRGNVFRWSTQLRAAEDDEKGEQAGSPIWNRLSKPSFVAAELAMGEASLVRSTKPLSPMPPAEYILLAGYGENRICFNDSEMPKTTGEGESKNQLLYLKRSTDYFAKCLNPKLIIRTHPASWKDLLRSMVRLAVEREPRINQEAMIRDLVDREEAFPSSVGHGVAIPHTYSDALRHPMCVCGQIPAGIEIIPKSGERIQLVFLLLSPAGDPAAHLATLAEIARLLQKDEVRQRLKEAKVPDEFLELLLFEQAKK